VAGASGPAGNERKWRGWGRRRSWEHEVPARLGVGGTSGRCRRRRRANPFRDRVADRIPHGSGPGERGRWSKRKINSQWVRPNLGPISIVWVG
jgi:hypothetical protein